MKERLLDPDCADLFKNMDPVKYLDDNLMIDTKTRTGLFLGEGEAARTPVERDITGKRLVSSVTVLNKNSFFFTDKIGDKDIEPILDRLRVSHGLGGVTVAEHLELVLLHDLVHADDIDSKYDDGRSPNPALNTLIRERCFKPSTDGDAIYRRSREGGRERW